MNTFNYSLTNLLSRSNRTFMEAIANSEPSILIDPNMEPHITQEIILRYVTFLESLANLFELDGADEFTEDFSILLNGKIYPEVHGFIRNSKYNPDPNHLKYATFIIDLYSEFVDTDKILEEKIPVLSEDLLNTGITLSRYSEDDDTIPFDPETMVLEVHIPLNLLTQIIY